MVVHEEVPSEGVLLEGDELAAVGASLPRVVFVGVGHIVVVAEDGEDAVASGACVEAFEDMPEALQLFCLDGDEVAGEADDVGVEAVDVGDDGVEDCLVSCPAVEVYVGDMYEAYAVEGGREVVELHLHLSHLVSEASEVIAVGDDEGPEGDGDDVGNGEGAVADVCVCDAAHRPRYEIGDVRDDCQEQGDEEEGDDKELHGCMDFVNDNKDITDFLNDNTEIREFLNDNTDNRNNMKNGRNCRCHEVTYNKDNSDYFCN